jgi:hypothetical protein
VPEPRCSGSVPYVVNDCICCAERKLLSKFLYQAKREGVHKAKVALWLYRKYGEIVVWRVLSDGSPGISLPCVLCRKALDKRCIRWRAHIGEVWHASSDENVPKSKSTVKQRVVMKFSV